MSGEHIHATVYRGGEEQSVFPIPFPFAINNRIQAEIRYDDGGAAVLTAGVDYHINRVSDGFGELVLLGDSLAAERTLIISLEGEASSADPEAGHASNGEDNMEYHYYDENGVYTLSRPAEPGTLPPINALRIRPPERRGFWPVVNAGGDGWELAEDHRGRRGWVDGMETRITLPGPLPEGWADAPSTDTAAATPEEPADRAQAYQREADPLRDAALGYYAEAKGWREARDARRERVAMRKAKEYFLLLAEKKLEIRERFPDSKTEDAPAADIDGRFCLAASGVYHAAGCRYIRAEGEWLPLEELLDRRPDARACGRCHPKAGGTGK